MEQITVTKAEYEKLTDRIRENLTGIVERFVYVGWLLNKVVNSEAYKLGGYSTVAEYAKTELGGMTADTVSRFVNVFKTYGAGDTPELKEEYKAYKYTMLVEMLQLPEEDRALVGPDTPRSTIRELNKFNAEQSRGVDVLLSWQQDTADLVRAAVQELVKGYSTEDMREALETEDRAKNITELMCPSGNKNFKKGRAFLMMSENDIKVKIFSGENKSLTWEEMAELVAEVLPEPEQEIAPAQEEVEKIPPEDITVEDTQIPGQVSIEDNDDWMPAPEPPAAPKVEKTEEQKYNEKQARIDKKTEEKLQQMEDEEKMQHLPSDEGQRTKQIRIGISYYEELQNGRTFDLIRFGDYREGDILEYMLFDQERFTGKSLKREITFILDQATGLENGWWILALKEISK